MAHMCPRCSRPVVRSAPMGFTFMGAAGVLIGAAVCPVFRCKSCGQIPRHEFPAGTRSRMAVESVLLLLGAIAIVVAAIWLITVIL